MFTLTFSNGLAITFRASLISNIYWKTTSVRIKQTDGECYEFAHKAEFDPHGDSTCTNYGEFLDFIGSDIDIPVTHRI
jgi:hypothetical protein